MSAPVIDIRTKRAWRGKRGQKAPTPATLFREERMAAALQAMHSACGVFLESAGAIAFYDLPLWEQKRQAELVTTRRCARPPCATSCCATCAAAPGKGPRHEQDHPIPSAGWRGTSCGSLRPLAHVKRTRYITGKVVELGSTPGALAPGVSSFLEARMEFDLVRNRRASGAVRRAAVPCARETHTVHNRQDRRVVLNPRCRCPGVFALVG